MKVLVTDDDEATRLVLRRLLTRDLNCTVIEAADGADALRQIAREPVDLLVLDIVMPQVDGLDTLGALRRDPRFASLPVVVLTADRAEDTVRRVMALGVADYLSKPLNIPRVIERLRRLIPSAA
ncbi:MAG TPA: response regulator [Vicinamibacterales bacterium]